MRLRIIGSWFSKPFVFFTLIMILKMGLAQIVIFDAGSLWKTMIAGIPSVWVAFGLIELLFPRRKLGAYLIADLLMTCIYFAVIMYYKYFGVIVTFHALQQVGQVTEVKGSVFSLLHPYFLLIYIDIVVFWILLAARKSVRTWGKRLAVRESAKYASVLLVCSLIASVSTVWTHRDSVNELRQAEGMGILNYEIHTLVSSVFSGGITTAFANGSNEAVDPETITPEKIANLKQSVSSASSRDFGVAKGDNLIIVQLEAFQNFLLDLKLDGQEVTPNLNKLMRENKYFPRFYQQVGQGNTSDAEYVVNTSLLIPQYGAASQDYGDLALPSMPKTLAEHGYKTATFHTNDVEFWNRKELYKALGFQHYYDKSYFGDKDFVGFGSSDEVLYAKTTDKLLEMRAEGKPFYAQLISMSAHHPFNMVPSEKLSFKLPERYQGTMVGDYIQAQHYADYALGQFVEKLKISGLWDESILVVYGDHMGLPIYSLNSRERDLMYEIYDRPYNFTEMLNIPLIMAVPGETEPEKLTVTGGQSDIFPTVANLLGISLDNHIHFGQDLLNSTSNVLPQRYYLPTGSFINGNGIFVPGDGFADGTNYTFQGEAPKAAMATKEEYDRALELLRLSDSYVSHLPKHN
ncbi:LTA synthase family protein [Cohnella faecalis]|uniref:LTA synthase family protein n=1 Tax=Cohnella faecalis TaxID=2315694 RepID=A0A398CS35_9BACL|nr:LTA synthase family protein [Cohnella faecalis]RIE02181.1 LTA synthase family protein [Cohnella faecalis]